MMKFSLFTTCSKRNLAIVFLCFLIVSCGDNSGSTDSTKAKKAVIVNDYYWSSSDNDYGIAWSHNFGIGQDGGGSYPQRRRGRQVPCSGCEGFLII